MNKTRVTRLRRTYRPYRDLREEFQKWLDTHDDDTDDWDTVYWAFLYLKSRPEAERRLWHLRGDVPEVAQALIDSL